MSSKWLVSVAVLMGLLSGCSFPDYLVTRTLDTDSSPVSSVSPMPTIQPLRACDVIQTSVLAELVGEPLNEPQPSAINLTGFLTQQSCLWTAASGTFSPTVSVSLTTLLPTSDGVYPGFDSAATSSTALNPLQAGWEKQQQEVQSQARYTVINDLGEKAFASAKGVHLLKGEYIVVVGVSLPKALNNRTMAETIAREIERQL